MIRSAVRLPMPGTAWKRAASPAAMAFSSSRGRAAREHGQRHLGAHALHADQHQEQLALRLGREAEQLHARRRASPGARGAAPRSPDAGHAAQRLGRHRQPVAHAAGLDHDLARAAAPITVPAHRRDHASASAQRRAVGVADRHREGIGGVVGLGRLGQREQRAHHPLHLALLGARRCRTPPA